MPKHTDKQKEALGIRLASVFNLKARYSDDWKGRRYMLGEGYLTKTPAGLVEIILDLADKINKGKEI